MKTRRLKTISNWINANTEYKARVRETKYDTDRQVGRFRHPGKGRKGFILTVTDSKGNEIYEHNSAETYRTNQEVENWIEAGMPKQPPDNFNDRHYA